MKVLGVIPARYGSSRFPGKPLIKVFDKTMIEMVYEKASMSNVLHKIIVATDDPRIVSAVENFGGNVMLTSDKHPSGTDRLGEVAKSYPDFNIYVNIQGDEPFLDPDQINELISPFDGNKDCSISTLIKKIQTEEELLDPGEAKVVMDIFNNILYFSRSPIPFLRNEPRPWTGKALYYKHVGLYAFTYESLQKVTALSVSSLESAESLEQLRWLENGIKITGVFTEKESFCIDNPEDLAKARIIFGNQNV